MKKSVLICLGALLLCAVNAAEVQMKNGWKADVGRHIELTETENGFTAKILKSGKTLDVIKEVEYPVGTRINFTADVKSNVPGAVMLHVVQPDASKHGAERYYHSRANFAPSDSLIAESDVRGNYKSKILVRIEGVAKNTTVTVENLKVFTPSGSGELKLEVAPSYVSAGYEVSELLAAKAQEFSAKVFFREEGGKFQKAYTPDYPPLEHKARGVLVNLKEDTAYELKLEINDKGKKSVLIKKFRTLGKKLPVAKTVVVTPQMIQKGLVIKKSGTKDGYIRYTSEPGTVLTSSGINALTLRNVNYIIIENMTIRGGKENGILVEHCKDIVIRNCDIALFGRLGVQDTRRGGEFYHKKRVLNSDAGIWMKNVKNILIEKNFIHDTTAIASPWFYSHPAGPKAVYAGMIENATMRYNDFIGGDIHRWNDAVEGMDNSGTTGGFFRNAEIYGNLFALSNDDGIELEGGEINCRFFGNRVENTLCGVSSGSCSRGPSYLFNNLFWLGGDVFGLNFNAFKNGHSIWNSGKVHLFNNTATGYRHGTNAISVDPFRPRLDKMVNYNNIFSLNNTFGSPFGLYKVANSASDYNLFFNPEGAQLDQLKKEFNREHNSVEGNPLYNSVENGDFTLKAGSPAKGKGRVIDNFTGNGKVDIGAFQENGAKYLPLRNIPIVTSKAIVRFAEGETGAKEVVVSTDCPKAKVQFNVVKTMEADWLKVTPDGGVVTKDNPVTLKVEIDSSKFKMARLNNTAFLLRTADGVSRPVTVQADSRTNKALLKKSRKNVLYADVKNSRKSSEFEFDVPEDGYYFVMLYGKIGSGKVSVSCDGKQLYKTSLKHPYETVVTALENKSSYFNLPNWGRKNIPIKLSAGKHVFKLKYEVDYAPESAALIRNANELMQSACVK